MGNYTPKNNQTIHIYHLIPTKAYYFPINPVFFTSLIFKEKQTALKRICQTATKKLHIHPTILNLSLSLPFEFEFKIPPYLSPMKAKILTIGDEILIGQIVDTNSAWMAQQLNQAGITVEEIISIGDTREAIWRGLEAAKDADLVLMTGGLGPTKDDITKKVLAEYFGVDLAFHDATYQRIVNYFEQRKYRISPSHKEQCFLPANATVLKNDKGTAPGMWFEYKGTIFVSMPGVPSEMKHLVSDRVLPRLKGDKRLKPIVHRTIRTVGTGESVIADIIVDFEAGLPDFVKLAYLPGRGIVRLRLSATGDDEAMLNDLLEAKKAELQKLIPQYIFGYEKETLSEVVGRMLKERGLMFGTAESCTGGYIAHQVTGIPGSSAYFGGSIVAYSNDIKMRMLGVKEATLQAHGAVSEETVKEMVKGALETLNVDYAVAVSGIAGPTGGTADKPVGLIWTAVGNRQEIKTQKLLLSNNRMRNIQITSNYTLNLLRKFLLAQ